MAEIQTLTPNLTTNRRERPPMEARVQSPTSPFFLGSNDDQLERAQARAARAAAFRRQAVDVLPPTRPSLASTSCLNRDQIIELFNNCVKLANENKINQKNTWGLKLIDHLSEIIEVEAEKNAQTNFQKASYSLEAGVKIYSVRVDACHADAYRVLSGISRAGVEDEQETLVEGGMYGDEENVGKPKKETERKVSPLSTVEPSFEALNVRKFDVAFAVDPLYGQASAQFDEGGAKGLLLYNLGVYGRCWVLFDSKEAPGKCMFSANGSLSSDSDLVDLSFAGESINQMVMNVRKVQEISPSLRNIIKLFDECDFSSRTIEPNGDGNTQHYNNFSSNDVAEDMGVQIDSSSGDDAEAWFTYHHDNATVSDEGSSFNDPWTQHCYEEGVPFISHEPGMKDDLKNFASLFCAGSRYKSMHNAWAGPDHWMYQKPKGQASVSTSDSGRGCATNRSKDKKSLKSDIDFTSYLDEEVPDIFLPAKNPNSLLLPPRKGPCSNSLPEDYHYQPEDLLKLFLCPNIMCLGKGRKRVAGGDSWQQGNNCDQPSLSRENENEFNGQYYDGFASSYVEQDTLIFQPRQVDNIEVQYDKPSKQVDVHLLKETLWEHMVRSVWTPEMKTCKDVATFRQVLATFPDDCQAAVTHHDISPHLCFICILHLANEHEFTIQGCPTLDDLSFHLPPAFENTGEVIQPSP